jgi:hypothetical protein
MFARAWSSWGRLLGLGGAPSRTDEDRRAWGRFPSTVETVCRPAGAVEGEPLTARVQDVSRGGIQLVLERAFEPGELLGIALPGAAGGETSTLLACVVRSQPVDGGRWALGCRFATQLSDEDLARFRSPAGVGTDLLERRDWVRFPGPARASFQQVGATPGPTRPAAVLNISAGGVALQVADPLHVGDLLSVELRRGNGQVVLTTLASVVRVTAPESGERLVGCNFIHELGDDDMQALQ